MTIKEIETLSGLPRANIRYYESEGLITPKRAENGYREYSQADAQVLLPSRRIWTPPGASPQDCGRRMRSFPRSTRRAILASFSLRPRPRCGRT